MLPDSLPQQIHNETEWRNKGHVQNRKWIPHIRSHLVTEIKIKKNNVTNIPFLTKDRIPLSWCHTKETQVVLKYLNRSVDGAQWSTTQLHTQSHLRFHSQSVKGAHTHHFKSDLDDLFSSSWKFINLLLTSVMINRFRIYLLK